MERIRVKSILQMLLAAGMLTGMVIYIDLGKFFGILSSMNLYLYGIATLVFLTTYIPSAARWKILSEATGHFSGLWESFKVMAVSYSFNKILPWNTGDIARSKLAEMYQNVENHGKLLGATLTERALDGASLIFVITFSLVFVSSKFYSTIAWITVPFIIALLIFTYISTKEKKLMLHILPEKFSNLAKDILEGFKAVSRQKLVEVIALSQAKWWIEAVVFYILALSLGVEIGFWEGAIVTSVLSLVSALPISPAGLGPADVTAAGLLAISGVPSAAGASLVLLERTLGLGLQGIIGSIIYGFQGLR